MTYPEHSVEQDQQNFEKPQSGHGGQRFAHFAKFFLSFFFPVFCFFLFHWISPDFIEFHKIAFIIDSKVNQFFDLQSHCAWWIFIKSFYPRGFEILEEEKKRQ